MKAPRPRGVPAPRRVSSYLGPILLVTILALGGLGLVAPRDARASSGSFHPLAGSTPVVLMATNALNFAPQTINVPTLQVEIEIENVGSTDHTFTLSSRVNQTAPTGTDASTNASGTWFDNAHILTDRAVPQGQTVFVNVTLPAVGSFQFICRYHFSTGMAGEIVVGTSSTTSSSSMPLYLYGGIAAAVIVALVVVVVLMRRSGTKTPPATEAPK
ncbi:MAG: plastocyanin/azurin family copper-binding protein [Thermoplasmata archaeon]|nr:plastocyanin/azurin family copper-binding protein [Thermoplasmata archaeon]